MSVSIVRFIHQQARIPAGVGEWVGYGGGGGGRTAPWAPEMIDGRLADD